MSTPVGGQPSAATTRASRSGAESSLFGRTYRFEDDHLEERDGSTDAYLEAVEAPADEAAEGRYMLPGDVADLVARAKTIDGRP